MVWLMHLKMRFLYQVLSSKWSHLDDGFRQNRKLGNYSKLRVSCDRDSLGEVKIGGLRY